MEKELNNANKIIQEIKDPIERSNTRVTGRVPEGMERETNCRMQWLSLHSTTPEVTYASFKTQHKCHHTSGINLTPSVQVGYSPLYFYHNAQIFFLVHICLPHSSKARALSLLSVHLQPGSWHSVRTLYMLNFSSSSSSSSSDRIFCATCKSIPFSFTTLDPRSLWWKLHYCFMLALLCL